MTDTPLLQHKPDGTIRAIEITTSVHGSIFNFVLAYDEAANSCNNTTITRYIEESTILSGPLSKELDK